MLKPNAFRVVVFSLLLSLMWLPSAVARDLDGSRGHQADRDAARLAGSARTHQLETGPLTLHRVLRERLQLFRLAQELLDLATEIPPSPIDTNSITDGPDPVGSEGEDDAPDDGAHEQEYYQSTGKASDGPVDMTYVGGGG